MQDLTARATSWATRSARAYAAAGGFLRPILHGLCTYGFACHAVLRAMCDYDATRIAGFDVRFTSPVFPGETLRTEMWRDGAIVSYRTRVVERDVVVLDHGKASPRLKHG